MMRALNFTAANPSSDATESSIERTDANDAQTNRSSYSIVEFLRACVICHMPVDSATNFTCCVKRHPDGAPSVVWHDQCLFNTTKIGAARCLICNDPVTVDVVDKRVSHIRSARWDDDALENRKIACLEEIRALTEAHGDAVSIFQRGTETVTICAVADAVLFELIFVALAIINQIPEYTVPAGLLGAIVVLVGSFWLLIMLAEHCDADDLVGTVSPDWTQTARQTHKTDVPWKNNVRSAVALTAFYAIVAWAASVFTSRNFAFHLILMLHACFIALDVVSWRKIVKSSGNTSLTAPVMQRILTGLQVELTNLAINPPSNASQNTPTSGCQPTRMPNPSDGARSLQIASARWRDETLTSNA